MKIILLLIGLLPGYSFGQNSILDRLHGTIILGAIGTDGIILASDSRTAFTDAKDSTYSNYLGYYDGIQKIHPLHKYAFAMSGDISDDRGIMFSEMLSQFDKTSTYENPDRMIFSLVNYLKTYYRNMGDRILNNIIIAGGYTDTAIATLSVMTQSEISHLKGKGWFWNVIDTLNLFKYSSEYSCAELSILAENAMKSYISKYNRNEDMGGPISILKIDKENNLHWIKKSFSDTQYSFYCEFLNDYFNTKIQLIYSSSQNRINLENQFLKARQVICK